MVWTLSCYSSRVADNPEAQTSTWERAGDDNLAGGSVYFFRWADGRLLRLEGVLDRAQGVRTCPETGRLEFLGGSDAVEAEDPDVEVRVDVWIGARGLYVGGVEVHTVNVPSASGPITPMPHRARAGVSSSLWRAIRIGDLVDETIRRVRDGAGAVAAVVDDEHLAQVAGAEERRAKRGPRPGVSPQVAAQVVAPAYLSGGRRPVVAVQEALQTAGLAGSGPAGEVTIDQARKAVARTRALGFLPAAEKRGGRR